MGLGQLTSREAVVAAIRLYDELGRDAFLDRYHFGAAHSYVLAYNGRDYDSKAIAAVAYGLQYPVEGPLTSDRCNGGVGPAGAATVLRRLGFVVDGPDGGSATTGRTEPVRPRQPQVHTYDGIVASVAPDVVLVGCVKEKLSRSAPAQQLYTSDLFCKRRAYAKATGAPWLILSALHGVVAPDDVLAPYDMALKDQSAGYRRQWGKRVVAELATRGLLVAGSVLEVHAGAAYVDAIATDVAARGARLIQPLAGLRMGEQLAWYGRSRRSAAATPRLADSVADAIAYLGTAINARPCRDFPWGRADLESAGLYSWWVDAAGAAALSRGLGQPIAPGLIYAGLAGATSPGRPSAASTLRSRIGSNHLRGGIHASTWRRSLAAVLRDDLGLDVAAGDLDPPSQLRLTEWMNAHLSLAVYPIAERAVVGAAEDALLADLDPPLNLDGMAETSVRRSLRVLRRTLPRRRTAG